MAARAGTAVLRAGRGCCLVLEACTARSRAADADYSITFPHTLTAHYFFVTRVSPDSRPRAPAPRVQYLRRVFEAERPERVSALRSVGL